MAKSQAVDIDVSKINDNFIRVKYTYAYVDNEDAKRNVRKKTKLLKGYTMIGKPVTNKVKFTNENGGLWTCERMYQRKDS